jgi:DNA-binding NtrC family response regulator
MEYGALPAGELPTAALRIAPDSGEIYAGNTAAAALLGCEASDFAGRPWGDVLSLPRPLAGVLGDALAAGISVDLPPALLERAGGDGIVVAIHLFPALGGDDCLLLLEESPRAGDEPGPIDAGDTVAVLGVGGLALNPAQGLADITGLMHDLHRGSLQILRGGDTAAPPAGTSIAMSLRNTDLETATDIGRALLSHLQPLLSGRSNARLQLGLARAGDERNPLATLVAANNALLAGFCVGSADPVSLAGEGDLSLLAAAAFNRQGLFSGLREESRPDAPAAQTAREEPLPPVSALETGIDGYVDDNMEGAIDQAVFLAGVDVPVAIIGPRGTGKLYVARIIHQQAGGAPDALEAVNCREFRGRQSSLRRISAALDGEEGRTLVFKSPHLMHPEVQRKLARQLGSRVLADSDPPRYLPACRYVALLPDEPDRLVQRGELDESLASVFAGYPIRVPPIRDRGRAVLRWAHKILGQECASRDRPVRGFTPDAERALLQHDWPGNISELRQAVSDALDHTDKDWITPVDLGLFATDGVSVQASAPLERGEAFLDSGESTVEEASYVASAMELLSDALGEAVNGMLQRDTLKPLGVWLDDEVVLAALKRFRGDRGAVAEFLQTRNRNVVRWVPRIEEREEERGGSLLWQEPRRLVQQWLSELPPAGEPPQQLAQDLLMAQVLRHGSALNVAARARIMGVSMPTYQKRLQDIEARETVKENA